MRKFLSFIVLTALSCLLAYFTQNLVHNATIISGLSHGLRYIAARLDKSSKSSMDFKKDSLFNVFDPFYSSSKSFVKRRKGYKSICSKYSDPMRPESRSSEPIKDVMIGFFDHGMLLCTSKRVGFKRIKVMSEQSIVSSDIYGQVKQLFKKDYPQSLKLLKHHAILVRHPLERIISVYRAEFEENINAVTGKKTPAQMSFPDFIELVVKGPELMREYKEQMKKKGESIVVDMGLIDGKGLSSLWNSYWNQCGLCHPLFNPEYIIHLETFKEDFKILNKDVLSSNQNIEKILQIKEEESGNHPSSDPDIIKFYYSQLKKEDIQALYEKYRPDHELFGYMPDYFLQFGKD